MRLALLIAAVLMLVGFATYAKLVMDADSLPPAEAVDEVIPAPVLPEYLQFSRTVFSGDFIDAEDLAWTPVDPSATGIPDGAIPRDDRKIDFFAGSLALENVTGGEFVRMNAILRPQQSRFLASVLKPGKRAISISVDAVTGSSGLIQPGNRVDLILTTRLDDDASSGTSAGQGYMARTILRALRVIAIDRRLSPEGLQDAATGGTAAGNLRRQGTATLEVAPRQAEIITVAQRLGTLSLSLRSEFEPPAGDVAATGPEEAGVHTHDVVSEFRKEQEKGIVTLYGLQRKNATSPPPSAKSQSVAETVPDTEEGYGQ